MSSTNLGKWISLLYRYGQIYIFRELEPYNIGKGQFLFLLTLFKNDGLSQEELARSIKIDKGTTARAISKLEKSGYIYKKQNENDMRANQIFLTQKGKDFKPVLFSILDDWTAILSKGMTNHELEEVFRVLTRMTENATEYICKARKDNTMTSERCAKESRCRHNGT